jgi:hypothetical protein
MTCKEPGVVIPTDNPEATDTDFGIGGSNIKTQSAIDSIDSQGAQSGSTSSTFDDANRKDTNEQDFAHASSDKLSHSGSSTREESAGEDARISGSSPEDNDLTAWLKVQPKKVNVKWCDYESFKNRFSTEEGLDIIEVLEGYPEQLRAEILHERSKRQHKKNSGFRAKRQVGSDENLTPVYRVRIQSPAILYILMRLSGSDNVHASLMYLRPFRAFYYSLPFAKHILRILERGYNEDQRHGGDGTHYSSPWEYSDGASSIETDDPLQKSSISSDVDMEDIMFGLLDLDSQAIGDSTAKEHIRLYVDFVEKHIVPMWVEARRSTKHKARFSDLPMYFRPGDVLFEPLRAGDNKKRADKAVSHAARNEGLAVYQNYWKLCHAQFEDPSSNERKGDFPDDVGRRILNYKFRLSCYHVDFDGDRYGPVSCVVDIPYYEGEIDIRSLVAYPLRFSPDATQTSKELTGRAKNFLSYVRERHLSYDGWTLIHETYGQELSRSEKRPGAEHIEGEVMIDFKEGFQSDSGFVKPRLRLPHEPEVDNTNFDPLLAIDYYEELMPSWWADTTRSKRMEYYPESFLLGDPFGAVQSSHMKRQDKLLRAFEKEEMVFDFGMCVEMQRMF